jgi:hypothetical protein
MHDGTSMQALRLLNLPTKVNFEAFSFFSKVLIMISIEAFLVFQSHTSYSLETLGYLYIAWVVRFCFLVVDCARRLGETIVLCSQPEFFLPLLSDEGMYASTGYTLAGKLVTSFPKRETGLRIEGRIEEE